MSSTSPASSADLHPLARDFNVWRKQRLARRSPVPADLRQRAVDLLPHYPQIRLSKALAKQFHRSIRVRFELHSKHQRQSLRCRAVDARRKGQAALCKP